MYNCSYNQHGMQFSENLITILTTNNWNSIANTVVYSEAESLVFFSHDVNVVAYIDTYIHTAKCPYKDQPHISLTSRRQKQAMQKKNHWHDIKKKAQVRRDKTSEENLYFLLH